MPPSMHFVAAVLVAAGRCSPHSGFLPPTAGCKRRRATISSTAVLPQGLVGIVFSPSFPYRLCHTVGAFFVTTAFVVLGVGAYTVRAASRCGRARDAAARLVVPGIFVPLQIVLGDQHGAQHARLSARQARGDRGPLGRRARRSRFAIGWPDPERRAQPRRVAIPDLGSLYLTHSWDGAVKGLKDFPADERPPVAIVYFAFRIMVGVALLMLLRSSLAFGCCASGGSTIRVVSSIVPARDLSWLYRRDRGMDHDRGRTPALDGLRLVAHGRLSLAFAHRRRRADIAPAVCGGLSPHLSRRVRAMLRLVWKGPASDEPERLCSRRPRESAHRRVADGNIGERRHDARRSASSRSGRHSRRSASSLCRARWLRSRRRHALQFRADARTPAIC